MEKIHIPIKKTAYSDLEIERLKDLLAPLGIELIMDTELMALVFQYDSNELQAKQTRNAGRPRAKKRDRVSPYTITEVKTLMKELPADQVAAQVGVSRATLYRKLKEADKFSKELQDVLYF